MIDPELLCRELKETAESLPEFAGITCSTPQNAETVTLPKLVFSAVLTPYKSSQTIAQGTITRAHAVNVFWMEHPDEVQALVKRVDPTAPSF